MDSMSRRGFLASGAVVAGVLGRAGQTGTRLPNPGEGVSFFAVSDTHYLAEREQPDRLDTRSAGNNSRLVDQLNRLPGTAWPDSVGGGTVPRPSCVLHGGDIIDSGDKTGGPYPAMQRQEWLAYVADYGTTGADGRLRYPVHAVHGNHDSPRGDGLVVRGLMAQNRGRKDLANLSANGLHASWDIGPLHCVSLGIVVGSDPAARGARRYNPLDSLDFLVADLKEKVGASGRPVLLLHHIDIARYATEPASDKFDTGREWESHDVRAYHQALSSYQIVAILFGHTHARDFYHWGGKNKKESEPAPGRVAAFNIDNSAHFGSDAQAFFQFQLAGDELIAREFTTMDGWRTGAWTPRVWRVRAQVPARLEE